jgi:murein DD-endopeptidase MepM/ murein hydrolase activator NlpD
VRRHHDGIDLAAPVGAPIRAIAQGQVVYADPHGGYGRYIVVKHADGYTSHYGHCDKVEVSPGQRVAAGEILGTVGNSGVSTGPHLHFEIRRNGTPQNPEALLPGLDERSAG